jgi:hypothetical protein
MAIDDRFSHHPLLALPTLQPHEYGQRYSKKAKALLGQMLSIPSRDTVAAFLLLAMAAAGEGEPLSAQKLMSDSESEVWLMTGLAVRMSVDLGLHMVNTRFFTTPCLLCTLANGIFIRAHH